MSKKIVKSLRGEDVDFDMLRIKSDLGAIPETADVKFRENIIQSRRRRKNSSKRKVKDMLAQQQINQKAVMIGLEKQRKQRADEGVKPVDELAVPVLELDTSVVDTESTETKENFNRKIRKNQSNGPISD
jgi:hypothetical protein